MITTRIPIAAFITLVSSACGSSGSGSSLNHYSGEIGTSIEGVEAALTTHENAVLGASDMATIQAIEAKHTRELASRMGDMQDAEDSMKSCGSDLGMMGHMGHMGSTQSLQDAMAHMMTSMDGMTVELGRHARAMQAAADVAAAHAEEQQHATMAQPMIDAMRSNHGEITDAMRSMAQQGMSMMCPMSSHMHRDW